MKAAKQRPLIDDAVDIDVEYQHSVVGDDLGIDYPKNKCIHHLFQAQAGKTPDRIAVAMGDDYLTYRELEVKSNQFAVFLKDRGVKPETLVGVCLDRSLEIIITILSILKAGGAYVPIDPNYPRDRIEFMLTDSECPILVTQTSIKSRLPETAAELVCYDEMLPEIEMKSTAQLDSAATPDNLAYVIYTSGSTGIPKGVMIEHRNVVRLLFNEKFQFDFTEKDVWSIFSSFCFDVSVWEMYGALLFGAKAVIIPKETTRDPRALAEMILQEKVTVVNQTPSAFYNLIPRLLELPTESLSIRYIIFAGEKLNVGKLGDIQRHLSKTKLINMYGITETTVHATYKEITRESISQGFSNVGKPIPTLKMYIFDRNMQLQPVGVKGELCVAGAGVARGYLKRDELTKARFISNPLNPEEIIYRSGDIACVRKNGDIEYFGRMDNQIQLRGFRIELGEIEAALTQLREVEDGLVICNEDANGDNRIIAYIVPAGKKITADILRRRLAERLPEYMIPSFFIAIDRLPLTDNGKLDQKRLPLPDLETILGDQYTPPENEIETAIAEIWSNILKVDVGKIGRKYNFFEIGGHSLAAANIAQQMRERFQKAVTLKHIYEHPILSDLSKAMMHLEDIEQPSSDEVADEITPASGILPLTSAQVICWIVEFVYKIKYANVCEVYNLDGVFDAPVFQKALNRVASRHDSLWHPFSKKKPMMHIGKPGRCEVELVDLSAEIATEKEEGLKALISATLHTPFDLSRPPHFRLKLIKKAPQKHLLLASFPHIVSDVASLNAFIGEVFDAYKTIEEDQPPGCRLRKTTAGEILQKEVDYLSSRNYVRDSAFWKEKFEDQVPIKFDRNFLLPFGKPTGRKLLSKIKLDENNIAGLQKISRQSNTSIQSIILALIQATLHTVTGQTDISTAMVCDMRGLHAYPPVSQMNSTVIPVRSIFLEHTKYTDLISHIKWYLVDALNHAQLPSTYIFTKPRCISEALKKAPLMNLLAWVYTKITVWRYRKAEINKDNYRRLMRYFFGMLVLLRNVRKKDRSLRATFPVSFNVMPGFYEDKVLWSDKKLKVEKRNDRELTMDPHVFEERSRYQDAILLNIDLLRDEYGDAYLYLWGGRFNEKAFTRLEELFFKHLGKMIDDPQNTIAKE